MGSHNQFLSQVLQILRHQTLHPKDELTSGGLRFSVSVRGSSGIANSGAGSQGFMTTCICR